MRRTDEEVNAAAFWVIILVGVTVILTFVIEACRGQ